MFKELEKYGVYQDYGIEVAEVKIQIPTGIIAGKWWGSKSIRPILCLHGWEDNAGTFDRLIPLLPRNYSYLAIDFPGNGRSDWLPDGTMYHAVEMVNIISYVMKEYKWEKVDLLGHSLGGFISMLFSVLYPERANMLICIDNFKLFETSANSRIASVRRSLDYFMIADERNQEGNEPPAHTIEEMIEKVHNSLYKSIPMEYAPFILPRSILPSQKHPGKFYFSRDSRIKRFVDFHVPLNLYIQISMDLKIPFLILNAKGSFIKSVKKYMDQVLPVLMKNPQFEYHDIDAASHHVHLTEPKKSAEIIGKFIEKNKKIQSHL